MSLLQRALRAISGGKETIISQQLVFNKVIGVKGLTAGVGTSTVVQSLAYYYSLNKNMRVCVVDTSFLAPIQESFLGATKPQGDILQYTGDISQITAKTKYKNVYLVSLWNRGIVDMLDKDNSAVFIEVLKQLKTYFDVVIIDICSEYTDIATTSAIKCNRIITVADQSNKCLYHLRNTLNTNATLAIAREKQRITILNKTVQGVKTSTVQSLEESGLNVVAEIPYSRHIAWFGLTGEPCYRKTSESKEHEIFNNAITLLAESFIEKNPTNESLHGDKTYKGKVIGEEETEVKGKKAKKLHDKNTSKVKEEQKEVEYTEDDVIDVTTVWDGQEEYVAPIEVERQVSQKPKTMTKGDLFSSPNEEEKDKEFNIFD